MVRPVNAPGRLYVPAGSRVRGFAEAIAWLWRLGALRDEPGPGCVGMGWLEDGPELRALVSERRLAGAAIFASRPGPDVGIVPGREPKYGVATFDDGVRVQGRFTVLHGGMPVVSSSLGAHATRDDRIFVAGIDPDAAWGTVSGYWLYPALADFLASLLDEPLLMLPPVGVFRYDDVLGNLSHQLGGSQRSDAFWRRRMQRMQQAFTAADAVANLAIAPLVLDGDELVTVEQLAPQATEVIRAGLEAGAFEVVAHGLSHAQPDALTRGELEPREFLAMDGAEAGERVDVGIGMLTDLAGTAPATFVAPNWRYGEGLMAALRSRGIRAWLPTEPGPLLDGQFAHETLASTLNGLHRTDYRPLGRLAHAGLPPTLVIHGGLFDSRLPQMDRRRDFFALARLAVRRDLFRVPWSPGIRWLGSGDLIDRLAAHNASVVEGGVARLPDGAEAILYDGRNRELVQG